MKRTFFVFTAIFLSSGYFFAQTKTSPELSNIAVGAPAPALHVKNAEAEKSDYFGYDNKIKAITIDGNIPVNLPTKKGYTVKSEYKNLINEWLKAHNAFVKPEFQTTLIKD